MPRHYRNLKSARRAAKQALWNLEAGPGWTIEFHTPVAGETYYTLIHEGWVAITETVDGTFMCRGIHPTLRTAVARAYQATPALAYTAYLAACSEVAHAISNEVSAVAMIKKADSQVYRQCARSGKPIAPKEVCNPTPTT